MSTTSIPFYVKLCLHLVSIYILGMLLYVGSDILMPVCFAIVLAMLLLPLVNWFIRKKVPGVLSIILAILIASLFAGGIIYFLSSQVASFMNDLPAIKEKLTHHISTLQNWVNDQLNISKKEQASAVESATQNIQQGTAAMGTALMGVASGMIMLVLLPIYTFLILYYRKLIHKFLMNVFATRYQDTGAGCLSNRT